MPIQINIPDAQIPALVEFYKQRLVEGEAKMMEGKAIMEDGLNMKDEAKEMIAALNGKKQQAFNMPPREYNNNWSWSQKVDFLLAEGPLSTSQIIDKILEYEPELADARKRVLSNVSAYISSSDKYERDKLPGEIGYLYTKKTA